MFSHSGGFFIWDFGMLLQGQTELRGEQERGRSQILRFAQNAW